MIAAGSAYLGAVLTTSAVGSKTVFLPGATTDGHYQIEITCESCHTPFQGVRNDACLGCHAEELAAADDSHPRSKFTDPRNADLLTRLDATQCVTCHREHRPEMTRAMGVTLPDDYCHTCHADVGSDRPSHAGLGFETCASAGCHNFHDNTALYEDFLTAHAGDSAVSAAPHVPQRTPLGSVRGDRLASPAPTSPLSGDAPPHVTLETSVIARIELASHARAGVNCTGCHTGAAGSSSPGAWVATPREGECAVCHDREVAGFLQGRHGMRRAHGLTAMTPRQARRPMKAAARDLELSCVSCHSAHAFDTRVAAVEACLGCHDDGHSRAYEGSPHSALWKRELTGTAPTGSGVSCATCHLPRLQPRKAPGTVVVQHNQNSNLRPNEKMTRTVCLACHGLGFALDALADPRLIASNFTGRPHRRVASIEMAARRAGRTPAINDRMTETER
jgi:hypothetical protein